MNKATFGERLRYQFDNYMSRGTIALVLALFAITALIIVAAACIIVFAGLRTADSGPFGFGEALWQSSLRAIDTGTVAGDTGWSFRGVAFLVTLSGIFILSALIGVLANGLEEKLSDLRRGRSHVVESGHTVILGWSPQIFTILRELAYANQKRRKQGKPSQTKQGELHSACVAILADKDKVEMEDEIRTKIPDMLGTRVVCRSGDPLDIDDLQIVSPDTARAIIIVSPGGQYPDLPVAKSLLALAKDHEKRATPAHIVTAIHRPTNMEIARMIGGSEAQIFMVDRLIAYVIAQTCRQPGLSVVYSELFSFEGTAMYITEVPELVGRTYHEALLRCESATLFGLCYADGRIELNPAADTAIEAGDKLVVLALSEDALHLSASPQVAISRLAIRSGRTSAAALERLLILGWNRRGAMILEQLNQYVAQGGQAKVVAPAEPEQLQADCAGIQFDNLKVTFMRGNPTDRLTLEKLSAEGYQYIILLNPMEAVDLQIADATTIVSLLHLRDIARKAGQKLSIVSEILDVRNRDLTQVTSSDDMIISEQLVAMALTQIAENKNIVPVFIDLLSPHGVEIYLKPVQDYLSLSEPVNFYTVLAAALEKGETAIGYRSLSEAGDPEKSFGVHLNPDKEAEITFGETDKIIVLARE